MAKQNQKKPVGFRKNPKKPIMIMIIKIKIKMIIILILIMIVIMSHKKNDTDLPYRLFII